MSALNGLMAAIDNMTDVSTEDVVQSLADHIVKVTIAYAGVRNEDDFNLDQVRALTRAYLEFNPEAEVVEGKEAEDLYHDEFQAIWQRDMGYEAQDWNGFDDWNIIFPTDLLKRVARGAAHQQAVDAKAFYRYIAMRDRA
jgi:hypothetical protein